MKTLYCDCSSGISGNMTLGALTEIIGDDEVYVYPEYESAKEVALKNNIPLKELYK